MIRSSRSGQCGRCATICALFALFARCTGAREWLLDSQPSINCGAVTDITTACLYEKIFYDTQTASFVLFAANESTHDQTRAALDRVLLRSTPVALLKAPPPPEASTCVQDAPSYLHTLHNPRSFGHVLRDNFNIIVRNLHNLSLDPRDVRLLLQTAAPTTVFAHYAAYVTPDLDTLEAAVGRCSRRFLRFRQLAIGKGEMNRGGASELCTEKEQVRERLLLQRDAAYALAGVPHVPVVAGKGIQVLLLDKIEADGKRIDNLPEVLPALKARFPSFRIRAVRMRLLSAQRQLELLSNTSIFVAAVGSSSFRLIYLPTGAHAIMLSAPLHASLRRYSHADPFLDADSCWPYMGYVRIDRYLSTEAGESVVRHTRSNYQGHKSVYNHYLWWDADTHVDVMKLGNLIEDAAAAIGRDRAAASLVQPQ